MEGEKGETADLKNKATCMVHVAASSKSIVWQCRRSMPMVATYFFVEPHDVRINCRLASRGFRSCDVDCTPANTALLGFGVAF